jgi:hypothetical protein
MTYEEWRSDPYLASQLNEILKSPVMTAAISVLEGMTAARTLGVGSGLVQLSDKAHVLFGYDAGRANVILDLKSLAIEPPEIKQIEPTYTGEF